MFLPPMILDASCHISFRADAPVPLLMMLRPRSGYGQWVMREEYALDPHVTVVEATDPFGNLFQRIVGPTGFFSVRCACRVQTADFIDVAPWAELVPIEWLPEPVLQFLLPSRYCQSDLLNSLAVSIVGTMPVGYQQAAAIAHWLRAELTYTYGSTNASTSALDTVNTRAGVCRDYAHLGIALCRSLNIPARMVVGYLHLLKPMNLHAWFEAYVGGRWYVFDGTQDEPRGNRIAIAYGRDAADVALITQFGMLYDLTMQVEVCEALL